MQRRTIFMLVGLALLLPLLILGCSQEQEGDKKPLIRVARTPYSSDWPCTYIVKYVAEDLGYKVDFVKGDIGFLYTGLAEDDIDLYPSCWIDNLHKPYKEKYGDKIDYPGVIYENAISGIGVPDYVDIENLADLKGKGEMFDNKIIGIEPGAGLMLSTVEAMKAYDLEGEYRLVQGSTSGMLASMDKAVKKQEPILFLPWRPHVMFQEFDIKVLKDDKGIFEPEDVYMGAATSLKEKAPDLYQYSENFKITINEIEKIELDGHSNEDEIAKIARQWVNDNQDKINEWSGQ